MIDLGFLSFLHTSAFSRYLQDHIFSEIGNSRQEPSKLTVLVAIFAVICSENSPLLFVWGT